MAKLNAPYFLRNVKSKTLLPFANVRAVHPAEASIYVLNGAAVDTLLILQYAGNTILIRYPSATYMYNGVYNKYIK